MLKISPVGLDIPVGRNNYIPLQSKVNSIGPNKDSKSIVSYLASSFVLASVFLFGGKVCESKAQESQATFVARPAENDFNFREAYIKAKGLIESKNYFSAIWLIQEGFFDREESIMYCDNERKYTYTIANELLEMIPKKHRDEYLGEKSIIGNSAKRDLNTAVEKGDVNLVKKVWRQYPHTSSGKEAAYLTMYYWLDTGQYENLYSFFVDEIKNRYLLDYEPLSQIIHFHAAHFFTQIGDKENLFKITESMLKKNPNGRITMGGEKYDIKTIVSKLREYKKGNDEWRGYLESCKRVNDLRRKNVLNGVLDEKYANSQVVLECNLKVDSPKDVSNTVVDNGRLVISLTKNSIHAFKLEDGPYKEIAKKTFNSVFETSKPAPVVIQDGNKIKIVAILEANRIYLLSLENDGFKVLDSKWFYPTGCNSFMLLPKEEGSEKRTIIAGADSARTELRVYQVERDKLEETQAYSIWSKYSEPAFIPESKTFLIAKDKGNLEVLRFQDDKLQKINQSTGLTLGTTKPILFPDKKTMALISQREVTRGSDFPELSMESDTIRIMRLENDSLKEIATETVEEHCFRSAEVSLDGKIIIISSSYNNDPALLVYKFEDDKLVKIGTFNTDFGGSWVYPYKPIILSDDKTIIYPCSHGGLYVLEISDQGLRKMNELDLAGSFMGPCIATMLNKNSNQGDTFFVGSNMFRFYNLSKPKTRLDYSFFETLK